MTPPPPTLLLVEDDDLDALAFKRAARALGAAHRIRRVRDGVEALSALRGAPDTPALAGSCLIILDLSLPRMPGLEFLAVLREDPLLRSAPIFVLTTSDHAADIRRTYAHNIAGYLIKSEDDARLRQYIQLLLDYCRCNIFP